MHVRLMMTVTLTEDTYASWSTLVMLEPIRNAFYTAKMTLSAKAVNSVGVEHSITEQTQ